MTPIEKQFEDAIDSILFSTEDAVFPEAAARLCYAIHKSECIKFKIWCDAYGKEYDFRAQHNHTTEQLFEIYQQSK